MNKDIFKLALINTIAQTINLYPDYGLQSILGWTIVCFGISYGVFHMLSERGDDSEILLTVSLSVLALYDSDWEFYISTLLAFC